MIHIKTLTPKEDPRVAKINEKMEDMFGGMVPKVFTAMNLRTDLLETILQYVSQLMIEDHGNSRFTKEVLAAYVSKLNSCAYWVDAHGAMVMAQGQLSRKQMQSILDDPEGSDLIDEKTRGLIRLAAKMTRESYKITPEDIESLRNLGLSDEMILESIHVIAFFNYLDRMADATGAPVENLQEMMANMT